MDKGFVHKMVLHQFFVHFIWLLFVHIFNMLDFTSISYIPIKERLQCGNVTK
jgi:hypothetical protein